MNKAKLITPVILCGGAGSRLWPLSREAMPKQFLPLFEGRSLFDFTLERISDRSTFSAPVIVTAQPLAELVSQSLERAKCQGQIVLEPCRRNSAAAIAVAIELLTRTVPDALMLVLASDQFIEDAGAFRTAAHESAAMAAKGRIITFGIVPDSPHTGYGYIAPGADLGEGICAVTRFIEKPTASRAAELLAEGCLWNSGNFLFSADVMRAEIRKFEPRIAEVASAVANSMKIQQQEGQVFHLVPEEIFVQSPSIAIDYAVLERTARAACKPVHYRWSDMGTWNSVWSHLHKDESGNVTRGPVSLHETRNSLIFSEALHTSVLGLENISVVVTNDSVLVAPRDVSSSLTELTARLKSEPSTQHLTVTPAASSHNWGQERRIAQEEGFGAKLVTLKPDKSTPLFVHEHSDTHVLIVAGQVLANLDDIEVQAAASASIFVPAGTSFRLVNSGSKEVRYLEVALNRKGSGEPA
jgi:mannose-1-phosphate guanylyltransferase/mannose-6-phosphate isomerase